jgi:hypothetical protein
MPNRSLPWWLTALLVVGNVACAKPLEEVRSFSSGVRSAAASSGTIFLSGNLNGSNLSLIRMPKGGSERELGATFGFDVSLGSFGSLAVEGKIGAGLNPEGVTLFEIDGLNPPRELSKIPVGMHPATLSAHSLSGNLLVVAFVPDRKGARTTLLLIDISEPGAPEELATIPLPEGSDQVGAVTLRGKLLLVAARLAGLFVYSVEDPASPVLLSHFDTPRWARGVDGREGAVYLSSSANRWSSDILVIDIENPRSPKQVTSIPTRGIAQRLVVSGDRLYVADRHRGLRVYDITSPLRPRYLGRKKSGSAIFDVAAADGMVVAWSGLDGSATVFRERR